MAEFPSGPPGVDSISNRFFGVLGVNVVDDPYKIEDAEAVQLQNAELAPDPALGGRMALVQRGGLAALNGSAMSGSVLGIQQWALKTTYTRTMYAARQTEDSNTFKTSTNGTSWSDVSTPNAPAADAKFVDENDVLDARRHTAFKNAIIYPGNGYTKGTDEPIFQHWDGTTATKITDVGSGTTTVPFVICDQLVANGKIYFAIRTQGGTAPNVEGAVLSLDLTTGAIRQIATLFGNGTGEMAGGAPACLAFYLGQLWVGLNTNNTTDNIGKVVRCYPDQDTAWTSDIATLPGSVVSLVVFKGALYAGTLSTAANAEQIMKRSPTAFTWSSVFSGVGAGGTGHITHGIVYGGSLYFAQYHSTAPTIHIKSSSDGSSWATSRDVDSADSGVAGNLPGGSALGPNSDLFFVFRSTTATGTDGFIMRFASAAWTKVDTDNFLGPITMLVQRSV